MKAHEDQQTQLQKLFWEKITGSNDPMRLKKREIKEGDWFVVKIHEIYYKYYVQEVLTNDVAQVGMANWLTNESSILKIEDLQSAIYLGRGKKKWYWKYLPWRSTICPFTKPVKTNE